jgi:hypothetical protein
MSKRGPKPRTPFNSGPVIAGSMEHGEPPEPTSDLSTRAQAELDRLVQTLRDRGTIAAADAGTITEAARLKAALDEVHERPGGAVANIKVVGILTSQLRGLRRELGLTIQPSRAPAVAVRHRDSLDDFEDQYRDPVASRIKLS